VVGRGILLLNWEQRGHPPVETGLERNRQPLKEITDMQVVTAKNNLTLKEKRAKSVSLAVRVSREKGTQGWGKGRAENKK